MNEVNGMVGACLAPGQCIPVRITFQSGGGAVAASVIYDSTSCSGELPARLDPTAEACVVDAARMARVPPFTSPTFTVNYPFRAPARGGPWRP